MCSIIEYVLLFIGAKRVFRSPRATKRGSSLYFEVHCMILRIRLSKFRLRRLLSLKYPEVI